MGAEGTRLGYWGSDVPSPAAGSRGDGWASPLASGRQARGRRAPLRRSVGFTPFLSVQAVLRSVGRWAGFILTLLDRLRKSPSL